MDISMCENVKCPFKEKCLRYSGKPNTLRQVYTPFKFRRAGEKVHCDHFIKMKEQ